MLLPIHVTVVQWIVWNISSSLIDLHDAKIMHGRTFFYSSWYHRRPTLRDQSGKHVFSTATQIEHLQPVLDSEPAPTTVKVEEYTTILSQPLRHSYKWNDEQKEVVEWSIYLDNLGHAQQLNYKPEKNEDYYLSAPETLLQGASCSLQTDIWMLGCLASRA